ncbi:MAG TPA: glutamyl-tRNA reductase, partial [Vicinamibacterales bacterium]|nr:glutamyl-tRNA reductase [Vicinamibacterales bacterium]
MHLLLLGVSHRTAPVDLRERLDFSSRDVGAAVESLAARSSATESVVLSTCNRSEIYVASADSGRAREELLVFLGEYHQLAREAFLPHLFSHEDTTAAHHLFRVAAGLDSLVLGEPQVLGQVKDAFQAAAERRCTGPLLSKTFHWAFGVGKRVRTETALGEGAVSISFAAVALARKIFGRLEGRRVLVVGAGEISALTAQHLRSQGAGEIMITNRTPAAADLLANQVAGRSVPWTDMASSIALADIVVTATGSQRPIITRADVVAATGRKRTDPLF